MTTIITAHEYEQEHEYEDETTETQVCDSCLDIAWDMGVQLYEDQVRGYDGDWRRLLIS